MDYQKKKPFRSTLMFSGGGLRFGYYLGMYQALCDLKGPPDLIIASCGGAFASGLIDLSDSPEQAYQMLQSRAFYNMFERVKPRVPNTPIEYTLPMAKRWLHSQLANRIPRYFAKSKAQPFSRPLLSHLSKQAIASVIDESLENPLWQSESLIQTNVQQSDRVISTKSMIIASRAIEESISTYRWQQVLRCSDAELAETVRGMNLPNIMANYNPKRICSEQYVTSDMPLDVAIRSSITDMYYLAPLTWQDNILMGAVLNLTPIELACQLSDTVYAEEKSDYDGLLAEPAIYKVFGFSANQRLNDVRKYRNSENDIYWVRTEQASDEIPPILEKVARLKGYIDVIYPDFATYQKIVEQQFEFGYQKMQQCLESIV